MFKAPGPHGKTASGERDSRAHPAHGAKGRVAVAEAARRRKIGTNRGAPRWKPSLIDSYSRRIRSRCGFSPGSSDRKSTRLNSSHSSISYAVFCLKKKKKKKKKNKKKKKKNKNQIKSIKQKKKRHTQNEKYTNTHVEHTKQYN